MPNTALLACLLTFASQACYWEASVAVQAIPAPIALNSEVYNVNIPMLCMVS